MRPVLNLTHRHARHDAEAPILEVNQVTVKYNGRPALEEITFLLSAGEHIAVVGPNGAGKSTLFKVIAGVLKPTQGVVRIAGHHPGSHICVAYVPQSSQVEWTFPVTVADVVMMGRAGKVGLLRRPGRRDWEYVHHCLETVGLTGLASRQIGALSGGERQRMFIARALAQEAELMLMDEPLTGLDVPAQEEVLRVVDELRTRRVTVMMATHDLNLAASRFDRVVLLNRRLVGIGHPRDVFTAPLLQAAYGEHLRMVQTEAGVLLLSDTCCGRGL